MKKILLLLLSWGSLQSEEVTLRKECENKIYLMTIPKSGSHLMGRLIYLITGKPIYHFKPQKEGHIFQFLPILDWSHKEFAEEIEQEAFAHGRIPFSHFNFAHYLDQYIAHHPELKVVITVRDLRDVCVSGSYYFRRIKKQLGENSTWDEQLMWFINNGQGINKNSYLNIHRNTEEALKWINRPNVYVFRFEDLVGPFGGGSLDRLNAAMDQFCEVFQIELTLLDRRFISKNLWGVGPGIFRKGKIGAWKEHFKPEHKQEFKKRFGPYLIALGYEEDDNW